MTTLTETITKKLLDAVDNPSELQSVLKEHSHSKGPLYIALAQATTALIEELDSLSHTRSEAEEQYHVLQQQMNAAMLKLDKLQKETASRTKELASLDQKLEEKKALLNQAKALSVLGFEPGELALLHDILEGVAVSQGEKLKETITVFFERVTSYEALVSLEGEVKSAVVAAGKAKAEAEQWQAEAKAAEAKCKVRKTSIDLTEKMLAQGVKASDLPEWTHILSKAGISPDHLAKALAQFASVEELRQNRQNQLKELEKQISELSSQVTALTSERDSVSAAITILRDKGLAEIEEVSSKTQEHLAALMTKAADHGELEHKAAALSQEIVLARAIREGHPAMWGNVTAQAVRELLNAIIVWCRADTSHNPPLPSPPGSLASIVYVLYTWDKVRLGDVLLWALSGLFTEEERKALGVK